MISNLFSLDVEFTLLLIAKLVPLMEQKLISVVTCDVLKLFTKK